MDTASTDSARAGVLEEVTKISSDPHHEMHRGYHEGQKRVMDYVDALYRKAAGSAPVTIDNEGITTGWLETQRQTVAEHSDQPASPALTDQPASQDLSFEERAEHAERDRVVEEILGESRDSEPADMQVGYTHLFAMPDGLKVYESFSPMINALGPAGDLWAIRSLAALGRICREHANNGGAS